jgi:hypothetical protein
MRRRCRVITSAVAVCPTMRLMSLLFIIIDPPTVDRHQNLANRDRE